MKLEKFKGFTNPLTKEGMWALGIVLGAIVLVSTAAYFGLVRQSKEKPFVLPATTTQEEAATEPEPTEMPTATPAEKPAATASPAAAVTPKVK